MIFHWLDKHPPSLSITDWEVKYILLTIIYYVPGVFMMTEWLFSLKCPPGTPEPSCILPNEQLSAKKYQAWPLTDAQQTSHHCGDALLSNLKYLLLLCHPSVIPAAPFLSSPRIFTEFHFLSVEMYYVSLTFCIKSCPYPTLFQAVSWLCGWGTPPYPILPFWSP